MLIFAWLALLLDIILGQLALSAVMPFFVLSLFLPALSNTTYNFVHVGLIGALYAAWFGFDGAILIVVMAAMATAFIGPKISLLERRFISVSALTCLFFLFGQSLLTSGKVFNEAAVILFLIQAGLFWIIFGYFERRARTLYV